MEVHRQQCQNCGSFEVRNILVRDTDVPNIVYVCCTACGELVARYKLSEYYHHGKGADSFIRSLGAAAVESGRNVLEQFKRAQEESIAGYREALKYLETRDCSVSDPPVGPGSGPQDST